MRYEMNEPRTGGDEKGRRTERLEAARCRAAFSHEAVLISIVSSSRRWTERFLEEEEEEEECRGRASYVCARLCVSSV